MQKSCNFKVNREGEMMMSTQILFRFLFSEMAGQNLSKSDGTALLWHKARALPAASVAE